MKINCRECGAPVWEYKPTHWFVGGKWHYQLACRCGIGGTIRLEGEEGLKSLSNYVDVDKIVWEDSEYPDPWPWSYDVYKEPNDP